MRRIVLNAVGVPEVFQYTHQQRTLSMLVLRYGWSAIIRTNADTAAAVFANEDAGFTFVRDAGIAGCHYRDSRNGEK
jgi:hypothetical protein